jgi:hypothetical protein
MGLGGGFRVLREIPPEYSSSTVYSFKLATLTEQKSEASERGEKKATKQRRGRQHRPPLPPVLGLSGLPQLPLSGTLWHLQVFARLFSVVVLFPTHSQYPPPPPSSIIKIVSIWVWRGGGMVGVYRLSRAVAPGGAGRCAGYGGSFGGGRPLPRPSSGLCQADLAHAATPNPRPRPRAHPAPPPPTILSPPIPPPLPAGAPQTPPTNQKRPGGRAGAELGSGN